MGAELIAGSRVLRSAFSRTGMPKHIPILHMRAQGAVNVTGVEAIH